MSLFCKQRNGRQQLIENIRQRLEYCLQFGELYFDATNFHRELSSIHFIDKIITTNWDDYFERECNAISIVTAEDFAFHNAEGRKVFKLHGSVSNYGSIVATNEDYKKCYKNLRDGLMGGYLKTILATKTLVFVGFSFSDFDFNKVYTYLKREMKDLLPHSYIVSLDKSFKEKVVNENVTFINTDGSFFFEQIRLHLEGVSWLVPKKNIEAVKDCSYVLSEVHDACAGLFLKNRSVTDIYNLMYQDGMQHAHAFLLYHSKTGNVFNPTFIKGKMDGYEKLGRAFRNHKNYTDFAYCEGYRYGLSTIFLEKLESSYPFLFIMGFGPVSGADEYVRRLKKKKYYHNEAERLGRRRYRAYLDAENDVVPHHRALLFDT